MLGQPYNINKDGLTMEKTACRISDSVAETLFIPLYMRALESKRTDAIIKDDLACELVNSIDYDFSKYKSAKASELGCAIRIRHFDRKVEEFIENNPDGVVVLIGCGLDTRYQRIKNKSNTVFYELDLPEVIDLREKLLPQTELDRYIKASMFEKRWMDELKEKHGNSPFIFIIEGVFMYFPEKDLLDFLSEIAERFVNSEIYFDICNKFVRGKASKHDAVKYTKAKFLSGFDSPAEIEKAVPNLTNIDEFYFADSEQSRWKLLGILFRLVPFLHNSFGIYGFKVKTQ